MGGSDDEAAGTNRCRQERLPSGGSERWSLPCPGTSGIFRAQIIGAVVCAWPPYPLDPFQPLHAGAVGGHPRHRRGRRRRAVHIEGDECLGPVESPPGAVTGCAERFGREGVWKPRWYILAVPEEAFIGGARSVFSLAAPDERRECYGSANSDQRPSSAASPTGPHVEKIWAEQEAKNAELREIDYSHIPPLRIADRYAGGPRSVASGLADSGNRRARRTTMSLPATRAALAAMTDEEILAHHRLRNPYISLRMARELHRGELKFWHLGESSRRRNEKAGKRSAVTSRT